MLLNRPFCIPGLAAGLLAALPTFACAAAGTAPYPPSTRPTPLAEVGGVAPQGDFDHSHRLWNELLGQHVHGDGFDYAAVKKNPAKLDNYLAQLHAVTAKQLGSWTPGQRYAFWINVYNAHTIKKIVDNYPLKSIRNLSGALGLSSVFDNEFIEMRALHPGGKNKKLSLNDVEHKILRERFKDARVHAAVNCASYSCPPLRNEAFVADRLDTQLDEQMRLFVNDAKRNKIGAKKGELQLSKIFDWFKSDFERDAKSVREYLLRYAPANKAAAIRDSKIKHLSYDWSLNDAKPKD